MLIIRQMGEEGFDLGDAPFSRMGFVVIKKRSPDPVNAGFFSAGRKMLLANRFSKLVEKFF
jgi:hypothetical protein